MDLQAIGHALASVSPGWLIAALALNTLSMGLRAVSWLVLLRAVLPSGTVAAGLVARATMIGVMVSALLPGRVGEPVRAWLVARRGGPGQLAVVLGTILSQTLVNLLALVVLAALALGSVTAFQGRAGALAGAAVVPLLAVLALVFGGPALDRLADSSQRRVRQAAAWTARQLNAARSGVAVLARPRRGGPAAAAQLGAWAVQATAAYALLVALHLQNMVPFAAAATVLLAVNITAVVPVTPSNVGVFQAACVAALAAYGVSAAQGIGYGLLLQAVEVATALMVGVPALLAEGVPLAELRRRR